jgi:hypothetical protein
MRRLIALLLICIFIAGCSKMQTTKNDAGLDNTKVENTETESTMIGKNEIGNVEIEKVEIGEVEIGKAESGKAESGNTEKEVEKAEIGYTENENTEIENTEIENTEIENTEIENTEIENTDIENTEVENSEIDKMDLVDAEDRISEDNSLIDTISKGMNTFLKNANSYKGSFWVESEGTMEGNYFKVSCLFEYQKQVEPKQVSLEGKITTSSDEDKEELNIQAYTIQTEKGYESYFENEIYEDYMDQEIYAMNFNLDSLFQNSSCLSVAASGEEQYIISGLIPLKELRNLLEENYYTYGSDFISTYTIEDLPFTLCINKADYAPERFSLDVANLNHGDLEDCSITTSIYFDFEYEVNIEVPDDLMSLKWKE